MACSWRGVAAGSRQGFAPPVDMGKFFAVTIIVIAIASAVPIVLHLWGPPANISVQGRFIDEQMSVTMIETGVCFLAAQLLLGLFIWKSSSGTGDQRIRTFPGGAKGLVAAAVVVVGVEVLALGLFGAKAWADIYLTPARPDAIPVQAMAGQFAYYFRYPGPDGKFGPIHSEQINEASANYFGLDPAHDPASKDDIVAAQMAVPVDRQVLLLMHSKDVGHSFFVRELRIQQDFVPGLDLSIHFTPTRIGRYEIVCTQLCGLGHYNMRAYLQVMSQEDFEQWLRRQAATQQ
jgi:cytochrome c oxidase subunit II